MKRWVCLAGILILGVAAMVVSERRQVDVRASPTSLLNLVADSERDLLRMPTDFSHMPDQKEIRIGDELANSYVNGQGSGEFPEEDAIVSDYVARVGAGVASHAHRKLPYRFHYIAQQGMVNAFALPGGHVFIGAGLLAMMDSEDELAAVLGHEIEHIDHFHCAERAQRESAMRHIPLGEILSLPMQLFEVGYSKDQELEADREGTRLAVASGYSANGAIRMFEAFGRLYEQYQTADKSPRDEAARLAQETVEGYFRSHPPSAERIAQVQKLIASEGWSVLAERDLRVAYIFQMAKARGALRARNYKQAEELATQSLRFRPDQPRALELLASAQFRQANFSGAAETSLRFLKIEPTNAKMVTFFARALAAADRESAANEFQKWAAGISGAKPSAAEVAAAGLALLNGKQESAQRLENVLQQEGSPQGAEGLGELGWWHYLAGEYPRAVELLSLAVQRIPDERFWCCLWGCWVARFWGPLGFGEGWGLNLSNSLRKGERARGGARGRAGEREGRGRVFLAPPPRPRGIWENPKLFNCFLPPPPPAGVSGRRKRKGGAAGRKRAAAAKNP